VVFVIGSIAIGAVLAWPSGGPMPVTIVPGAETHGDDNDAAAGLRIDINHAPHSELTLLPGIGPSLADAIIASRERDGDFPDVDSLTRVRGIGPQILAGLRDHVVAGRR
jgi:competence protein ComEA